MMISYRFTVDGLAAEDVLDPAVRAGLDNLARELERRFPDVSVEWERLAMDGGKG